MGSTLPSVCGSSGIVVPYSGSDVEEAHVFGVRLDESPPGVDVVAHERRADLFADNRARRGEQRLALFVLGYLGEALALDVQYLAPDRENGLEARVTRFIGAAAGAVALDDEELGLFRVACRAVGELAWHQRGL